LGCQGFKKFCINSGWWNLSKYHLRNERKASFQIYRSGCPWLGKFVLRNNVKIVLKFEISILLFHIRISVGLSRPSSTSFHYLWPLMRVPRPFTISLPLSSFCWPVLTLSLPCHSTYALFILHRLSMNVFDARSCLFFLFYYRDSTVIMNNALSDKNRKRAWLQVVLKPVHLIG